MKSRDEMKIINLIIKQKYFDEIMRGEKKEECRLILKEGLFKRYVELDDEGYIVEDENHNSIAIKYDAIQFFVGYRKDRDSALVEVKDARTEMLINEDGEPILINEDEEGCSIAERVIYKLGKVLEKNIHKRE